MKCLSRQETTNKQYVPKSGYCKNDLSKGLLLGYHLQKQAGLVSASFRTLSSLSIQSTTNMFTLDT